MKDTLTRRLSRLMFRVMAYRPPQVAVPPQGALLTHVTVVNPGQERREGQTLVVEGGRITRISPSEPQRSDEPGHGLYAGTYVLPGLIDMHVHIAPSERALINLLFLAHGVTTVREAGDADGTTWRARDRIRAGQVAGPRIFASGPVLDGDPPFLPTSWVVRDAHEARDAVGTLAAQGIDFVKVHHKLSATALAAIREAAEKGLRVAGHIPQDVPFEEARIWDVQHLNGVVPPSAANWLDLDAARIDFVVSTSVEQGIAHTPTLVTVDRFSRLADPEQRDDPAARLLPRHYRDVAWNRQSGPHFLRAFSDEALATMKQELVRMREVVLRLHRAGVRIHLGTDTTAAPFVVPGVSLHEELGHMVDAGLTTEEAWAAATWASGESLGVPLLGIVREGAPADLAIFGQDPTADLAALSTLRGVIAQGRLYPRSFLDAALARHRERFERPVYSALTTTLIRAGLKMMAAGSEG